VKIFGFGLAYKLVDNIMLWFVYLVKVINQKMRFFYPTLFYIDSTNILDYQLFRFRNI
jgi:hypothetical protein